MKVVARKELRLTNHPEKGQNFPQPKRTKGAAFGPGSQEYFSSILCECVQKKLAKNDPKVWMAGEKNQRWLK